MTNTTTVYTEKKEERYIILFLTGLALYCIGYLLRRIGEETDIIRQPLQYLGFLILIIAAYKSISFRRNHYSTYIQYSMYALLLWHIYTILHNFRSLQSLWWPISNPIFSFIYLYLSLYFSRQTSWYIISFDGDLYAFRFFSYLVFFLVFSSTSL